MRDGIVKRTTAAFLLLALLVALRLATPKGTQSQPSPLLEQQRWKNKTNCHSITRNNLSNSRFPTAWVTRAMCGLNSARPHYTDSSNSRNRVPPADVTNATGRANSAQIQYIQHSSGILNPFASTIIAHGESRQFENIQYGHSSHSPPPRTYISATAQAKATTSNTTRDYKIMRMIISHPKHIPARHLFLDCCSVLANHFLINLLPYLIVPLAILLCKLLLCSSPTSSTPAPPESTCQDSAKQNRRAPRRSKTTTCNKHGLHKRNKQPFPNSIDRKKHFLEATYITKCRLRLEQELNCSDSAPHYLKMALAKQVRRCSKRLSGILERRAYRLYRYVRYPHPRTPAPNTTSPVGSAEAKDGTQESNPCKGNDTLPTLRESHPTVPPPMEDQTQPNAEMEHQPTLCQCTSHCDPLNKKQEHGSTTCQHNTCCNAKCHGQCQNFRALCPEGLKRLQARTTFDQLLGLATHQVQLVDCQHSPLQHKSAWVYCPPHLLNMPHLEDRLIPLWVNDLFNLLQDTVHEHLYLAMPAKDPPDLTTRPRGWVWVPADYFLQCFGVASSKQTLHDQRCYSRRLPRTARQRLRTQNPATAEGLVGHMEAAARGHPPSTKSTLGHYAVERAVVNEEQSTSQTAQELNSKRHSHHDAKPRAYEPVLHGTVRSRRSSRRASQEVVTLTTLSRTQESEHTDEPLRGANGHQDLPNHLRQHYPNVVWFRQMQQFCWIHAHNMLLQRESIVPQNIISSLNTDVQNPASIGKEVLRSSYGQVGPLSSMAVNRYLYKHSETVAYYKNILTEDQNQEGLTKAAFTALVPPGTRGALIAYTPPGLTAGHMKCIRYINADSKWYALDSMVAPYICPLDTDEQWVAHTKRSSIYVLLKADALPWQHLAVPCPQHMANAIVELDHDTAYDIDGPLNVHQQACRHVNDNYSANEVALHSGSSIALQERVTMEIDTEVTSRDEDRDQGTLSDPNEAQLQQNTPSVPTVEPMEDELTDAARPHATAPNTSHTAQCQAHNRSHHANAQFNNRAPTTRSGRRRRAQQARVPVRDIRSLFHNSTRQESDDAAAGTLPPTNPQQPGGPHTQPQMHPATTDTGPIPNLKVMTLNVRGLQGRLEDVLDVLQDHQPDVLVLTETKLTRRSCSHACRSLSGQGYVQRHSACKYNPSAGVSVLVKKSFADLGNIDTIEVPGDLGGYIKAVQLRLEISTPLTIVGVYMPTSHASDKILRSHIYRKMTTLAEKANDKQEGTHNIIFAGDFNATLTRLDRASGNTNPMDTTHQTKLMEAKLYTLDPVRPGQSRAYTWRQGSAEQPASRIDDMLTNNEALPASAATRVWDMTGTGTDHNLLEVCIPYHKLNMLPPPPPIEDSAERAMVEKLKRLKKLTKEEREGLKLLVEERHGAAYHQLNDHVQHLLSTYVHPHWDALADSDPASTEPLKNLKLGEADHPAAQQQLMEELNTQIADQLMQTRDTILAEGPTTLTNPTGHHYRPRLVAVKRDGLIKLRKQVVQALRLENLEEVELPPEVCREIEALQRTEAEQSSNLLPPVRDTLKLLKSKIRKELRIIDKEHQTKRKQNAIAKRQALYDQRQKIGNQMITGQFRGRNSMQLRAIKTGDDRVVTDPNAVMEAITNFYTPKMMPAAGPGSKTGLYHPSEQPRSYPWLNPNSPDRFDLATAVTSGAAPRRWLHNGIMDQQAFQACLKSLSRGKAPGPDQITNEMLNMLPPQGAELLHGYIQLMWATGYTPKSWKESTTVLLFKNKGTPLKLQYYRRIGLEITIYKLWTRMITWALADYAERHNILSYTQGGFRNKRTCMDQLELFTMLLEDAKLTRKDVYLLMVDFSEAFDTIDHDKLLQIMFDLGFPTDATEVVKNLYTGATTAFVTPFGKTTPIPMDRGTIQGDSLSPFLFILYLEPLLRWLRVGARGYTPGAYNNRDLLFQLKQHIPDVTYADDLNLICSSPADLMTQADKVTMYADWGHLNINSTKTLLTGARYCTDPKDPYNVQKLQRTLAHVKVQRAAASFHDPRTPFRYLGVQFTINLDWSAQYQLTRDTIREMCQNMKHSYATTSQKMRTLNSCIRTKIRYAFCVAPYTKAQLKALDSPLCKAAKEAYGLPNSTATAVAHEDINKGGLGCPSLLVEYNTVQLQRLTEALNDPGPLGELSRTRLQTDGSCLDKLTATARPALAHHSMRLRQLLACASIDVELRRQGIAPLDLPDTNSLMKDLQTLQAIATPQPPALLLADLHQLKTAGLHRLQDLMTTTGRNVLTVQQLTIKMDKQLSSRTITAFKRVAYMLNFPPGITKELYCSRPPPQAGQGITVHPEYARLLKLHHLTNDMDLRAAPLPTLWAAQLHAPCTEQAMTEIETYMASLINDKPRGQAKSSSVRQTATDITAPLVHRLETGYSVYCRIKDEKRKVFKDMREQLYNNYAAETDIIDGIEGLAVAARHKGKGCKRKKVATQNQVIVRWAPTVMQGWMVELAKQKGYQIDDGPEHAPKLLTHQEVCNISNLPTECCCPNTHLPTQSTPADQTLAHCNVCSRRYHVECLPPDQRPWLGTRGQDITAGWTCKECEWKEYAAKGLPPQLGHYQVHWKPSWESENDLVAHNPIVAEMIAAYRQQQAAAAAVPQPAVAPPLSQLAQAQQGLSAMQQQGDYYPDHPQRYNINIGQQYSNMFDMDTTPVNPHTDIHPTGRHEVFTREVEMCIDGQRWIKTLACIYTPDGKCRYTLTPERAAILYKQYCHSSRYKPKMMKKLKAGSFPEEVYALMCRYRDGAQVRAQKSTRTVKIKNHWATPPEIYEALRELTGITKERFASPLNYNPTFQMYWSAHKKDQIFGAKWDSYRYQWTGGSVHNPEYEDEDLNKNIATAIAAARSTTAPVFGIHILPAWSDANKTAYLAWLQHFPENCKHLLQVPKKHFRFQKPTTWERGDMFAGHPRWDVNIIVTGNARGFEAHLPHWDRDYMTRFLQKLQEAINASLPDDKEIQDLSEYTPQNSDATYATPSTLTPKQLTMMGYPKERKQGSPLDDSPTLHDPPAMVDGNTTLEDLEQQLPDSFREPPPLRHNWKDFAYTDGSYKPKGTGCTAAPADEEYDAPGIGAGVYFPPQAVNEEDDRAIPIIPLGETQPQNTINRAELVGILAALKHGANRIATDSLSSMYQIKKMLRRPQDLLNHQHCQLIKEIAAQIMNGERKTTLHKVKAHTSIIGNEKADEIAKAAATGETPYAECEIYDTPSNDRSTQYWPYVTKWQNFWVRENGQRRLIDRVKQLRPLTDLQDSARKHCHQTSRFGMANRTTCYFEAFKKIEDTLDLAASNQFMTLGKVTFAERKIALRYRYGNMWTRKMAYRCGHAPNSKCLLCGEEDGGHHTASGCPALKNMYINRHNKIGRLIMTRVLRGRKGAFVIQMDLGSAEKCAEDGITTHQSRTIPWESLPHGLKEAVQCAAGTTSERPDGLLYKPRQGTKPAEYWIIEVKICKDSDPQGQQSKADYQHQILIEKIKELEPNAKVWLCPILVGVTGTMYLSTANYLQELGIKGDALKKCTSEVHIAAVKSLYKIYTTKRKLEKPKEPVWHRKNYKKAS